MPQAASVLPRIIQGGMGIGVSNWVLARAVAMHGQMGVVSGTCMDSLMVRRLQDGDLGGHVRRAIAAFPFPEIGSEVIDKYFLPGGREEGQSYALLPMYKQAVSVMRDQITILHDRNGDGEADFYENFNNQVMAATNFHAFTMNLVGD